jgi:uncharacterized membrane protein YgcG
MIKSATFISIAVTTFVLILLAGVVFAYQGSITSVSLPTAQASSDMQAVALPVIAPSPTNIPAISPQDAASIAVKFSNRTDLYSVELADFNGFQTYKVVFSSGDAIYVAMDGKVVGVVSSSQPVVASPTPQPMPAVVYTGPVKKRPTIGNGGGDSNSGGGGGGEHEGGGD